MGAPRATIAGSRSFGGEIRRWGALSCLLGTAACGSGVIQSADAAGKAGARLAHHESAVAHAEDVCVYRTALGLAAPGEPELCAAARQGDVVWRRAVRVLAGYGSRLSALATTPEAELDGAVDGALLGVTDSGWAAFSPAEREKLSGAVTALTGLVSQTLRKSELARITALAAPHVDATCGVLAQYFVVQIELIDSERDVVSRHPQRHTDDVGSNLAFVNADARLRGWRDDYRRAQTATSAFCKAHQALVKHRSQLTDPRTYQAVAAAAASAYAAVKEGE